MPHSLTDVSTFTAPAVAPADGDNDAQASFDPAFQALANRTRFLLDKALGGVTAWPIVGEARVASLMNALPDNQSAIGWFSTRPFWTATTVDAMYLLCGINDIVKSGEVITAFDALCKPGAARSAANGVLVDLCYVAHDWLTPTNEPVAITVIAATHDDGTSNKQRIVATPFTHTVDRTINEYFFRVRSGSTASAASDFLYALRLIVTRPTA